MLYYSMQCYKFASSTNIKFLRYMCKRIQFRSKKNFNYPTRGNFCCGHGRLIK